MPQWAAMASLLAAMAMTGANVPIGKLIVAEIPIATLLVLRFAVASLILAVLVRREPGPSLAALTARQWTAVFVLGFVGSLLFTAFLLAGAARTSGVNAGVIVATLPAVIAGIAACLGHWPTRGAIAMIGLSCLGIALIQANRATAGGGSVTWDVTWDMTGDVLVGAAVLCEATFVLVSRSIAGELSPLRLSLAVSLASLACCLPFAGPALVPIAWSAIGWTTMGLLAWYIATSSIGCTVLWYRGVAHVAAWRAGLATAAVPVAALAVAALVAGETIGILQAAGAGVVIAAIIVGAFA